MVTIKRIELETGTETSNDVSTLLLGLGTVAVIYGSVLALGTVLYGNVLALEIGTELLVLTETNVTKGVVNSRIIRKDKNFMFGTHGQLESITAETSSGVKEFYDSLAVVYGKPFANQIVPELEVGKEYSLEILTINYRSLEYNILLGIK